MNDSVGCFSSKKLRTLITHLPQTQKFWIGFSGGADSTALIYALHCSRRFLKTPFHAIHFHHGLNTEADIWLEYCRDFCAQRNIPFSSKCLKLQARGGVSIEEDARNARYAAMAELLDLNDIYLTAHHADDQAETLFLNLMRGSGVEGLAGIPGLRSLGAGLVARPLLGWKRSDLENYLQRHGVEWLQDPSNFDESFDRSYLRNHLFPLIESRWPGLINNLNRSAQNARMTSEVLAQFINSSFEELLDNPHRMPLESLLQLKLPMRALVLRQWLRSRTIPALSQARLQEFLNQLADATPESRAEVKWDRWQLKLHRQHIWLQNQDKTANCSARDWTSGTTLQLDPGLGYLKLHGTAVELPQGWRVGPRSAGKKIRLQKNGLRRSLKDLYRRFSAPPWLRPAIPVLYWDDQAVAIGDWIIAQEMKDWLDSNSLEYRWHPADSLLKELQSVSRQQTIEP